MPARTDPVTQELQAIAILLRHMLRSLDHLRPPRTTFAAPLPKRLKRPKRPKTTKTPSTERRRITPERQAALKLQGRYLGYMRQLNPAQKARVKKVRAAKGIRAAITMAKRLSA